MKPIKTGIIGFGRMGRAICQSLAYRGKAFVLIDSNEDALADADPGIITW